MALVKVFKMASRLKMISSRLVKNVVRNEIKVRCFSISSSRCYNKSEKSGIIESIDRDPAPYFFNDHVQKLLSKITGLDLAKVFAVKPMEPAEPTYRFATKEQLEKMIEESKQRAKIKLQMPPVLKEREPINEVLSQDPELKEFENCKLIFTDVTYGISDRKRLIVARDPDGTLRKASWEERDRMNQIFFPKPGRKLTLPKIFEEENFKRVLDEKHYKFILDLACIQFEPDDPIYIRVVKEVYTRINSDKSYDELRSTRHFGPMAFHLAFHNKIDNLLLDMINRELLDDAVSLIQLFLILHPRFLEVDASSTDQIEFIRAYASKSSKQADIELALKLWADLQQQKQQNEVVIKRAHGHSE